MRPAVVVEGFIHDFVYKAISTIAVGVASDHPPMLAASEGGGVVCVCVCVGVCVGACPHHDYGSLGIDN